MTTTAEPLPPPATVHSNRRNCALWMATFLGFPLGGLPAIALGGVDGVGTALAGGAAAGVVIGAGQWLVLRRILPGVSMMWAPATAMGLALGLAVGSAVVGYSTGAADLIVQGAISGVGVGGLQALVLQPRLGSVAAACWAGAAVVSWPLGWTVTRAFGVSVEDQFAVFGATGAIAYTALSALVLFTPSRRSGVGEL